MAGLPIAALSFAMVWYALWRGMLAEQKTVSDIRKSFQTLKKSNKEEKQRLNPVHEKWFKFGGGFYGIVALYTWLRIEWDDVVAFLGQIDDLVLRLELGVLIELFINSIMNFVTAIAWPAYWLSIVGGNMWVWFFVAYGGYVGGIKLAQMISGRTWPVGPQALIDRFAIKNKSDQNEP